MRQSFCLSISRPRYVRLVPTSGRESVEKVHVGAVAWRESPKRDMGMDCRGL